MAAPEYSPAYPPAPSAPYGAQPAQPQYPYPGSEQGYYPAAADQPLDAYGQPVANYPAQPGYPKPYQPYPAQLQGGAPPPAYQQSSANTTVVVAQQPAVVAHTVGIKPNNYLILSIVNLLFCFFILGLIALIFSLQVDSAWTSGRYEEARRSSNTARILNYIGIGVGIAVWVFVGIGVVIRIVFSATYYSY